MDEQIIKDLSLQSMINQSLHQINFVLYFQPRPNINNNKQISFPETTFSIVHCSILKPDSSQMQTLPLHIQANEPDVRQSTIGSAYCIANGLQCDWYPIKKTAIASDVHIFFKVGGMAEDDRNICYVIENGDYCTLPFLNPQRQKCSLVYSAKEQSLFVIGGRSVQNVGFLSNVEQLCLTDMQNMFSNKNININSNGNCVSLQSMKWKPLPSMMNERENVSSVIIGDGENEKIFVCGGWNKQKKDMKYCELYEIGSGHWIELPPMLYSAQTAGICYWQQRRSVVVVGGWSAEASKKASLYDMQQNRWQLLPDTLYDHCRFPSVSLYSTFAEHNLIVVAGNRGIYDMENSGWGMIEFLDIRDSRRTWSAIGDVQKTLAIAEQQMTNNFLKSILRI